MNFSLRSGVVRGELFVRRAEGFSGKWKYTIALDMADYYGHPGGPYDAVLQAWADGLVEGIVKEATQRNPAAPDGYWLVVQDPYHRNAYPVMVAV